MLSDVPKVHNSGDGDVHNGTFCHVLLNTSPVKI